MVSLIQTKKNNKIKTSPCCIPASGRCSLSASLPPACHHPPRPVRVTLFPKLLNEWCFCGRVSWGFCRARRPECHRSRLIYPPPLSSCYAWSLNFPFLLFFLCFCSQIPPRPPLTTTTTSHPAPFTSNFFPFFFLFCGRPVLAEHDTCEHTCHTVSSPRARSDARKYVMLDGLAGPKCDTQQQSNTRELF